MKVHEVNGMFEVTCFHIVHINAMSITEDENPPLFIDM